jgi:hypothetical protein
MADFAVVKDNKVLNIIVCDSLDVAKNLTGLDIVETTGEPWIDWTLIDGVWAPPTPFDSWVWSGTEWQSPIPKPGIDYEWSEDNMEWVKRPAPFESWTWDSEYGRWVAPIPKPEGGYYTWNSQSNSWQLVNVEQ